MCVHVCGSVESRRVGGFKAVWVLGLGSWVLGLESWVLGLGSWLLALSFWVETVWVLGFGSKTQKRFRFRVLYSRRPRGGQAP
eukprot:1195449-Prorocentrum_minimum.AAC.2